METLNLIPQNHIDTTCKPGQGKETCRYIGMGAGGFRCLKHTEFQQMLDERVEQNTIRAQGDNCEGLPGD